MKNILKFITTVGDVTNVNITKKIIYLLTNLIYFIPIILYGINKITIAITIIGIIRTIYHSFQCNCSTDDTSKNLLLLDSISGIIIGIYIILNFYHLIPYWWYILLFLCIIIYTYGTDDKGVNMYLILHSLWHIFTGLLFWYVAYIYNNEEK